MKVVISVTPMQTGSKNRGIGAYTRELVNSLSRSFKKDKFIPTSHDYFDMNADVVHFPFFDPFFLTLPRSRKLPTVVTIHDLIQVKYKSHFPRGIKGNIKWLIQRSLVRKVDHIITDSKASSRDIIAMLAVDSSKVSIIPLAPASDNLEEKLIPKIKLEYSLPGKYLLYVGDINWNKNVPGLIDAYSAIQEENLHLVLVGKAFLGKNNIKELKEINAAIARSAKKDLIHKLGFIPSHHLPCIFKLATLYVQPSFDEGFGLPILEAMRVGCPVVCSDRGSLREVGGDAAYYFDPEKDMAKKLSDALESKSLRDKLIKNGYEQVKKFTWRKVASATRAVYANLVQTAL